MIKEELKHEEVKFDHRKSKRIMRRLNPNVPEFRTSNYSETLRQTEMKKLNLTKLKNYQLTPRGTSLTSDPAIETNLELLGIKKSKEERDQLIKESISTKKSIPNYQQKEIKTETKIIETEEVEKPEIVSEIIKPETIIETIEETQPEKEMTDEVVSIRYKFRSNLPKGLKGYDGTPIHIVNADENEQIIKGFMAGMYGVDTESDYRTNELRIIQIYDGKMVYIFFDDALAPSIDCPLTKFMSSKDRIKIGVDIDGDIQKMQRHLFKEKTRLLKNKHYDSRRIDNLKRYSPSMNGFIDLQSLARTFGDWGISLDKLANKYVDDFKSNETLLGSYIEPTNEQYIYAANDAIISLKIYIPLISRKPTQRWLEERAKIDAAVFDKEEEKTLLFGWIVPLVSGPEPKRISVLVSQIVNSYKRWQNNDRNFREVKAYQLVTELAEDRMFDEYDRTGQTIRLRQIELKDTNTTKSALLELEKERKEKEETLRLNALQDKQVKEVKEIKVEEKVKEKPEREEREDINLEYFKIACQLESADRYIHEHPNDFSILPTIKELVKVSEEKLLKLRDRHSEDPLLISNGYAELLEGLDVKSLSNDELHVTVITLEIIRDYQNILSCLKKCVTQNEGPKAKIKFIKQIANSYGYWKKSYPTDEERQTLADVFFDIACEKGDIISKSYGLFSLKRK